MRAIRRLAASCACVAGLFVITAASAEAVDAAVHHLRDDPHGAFDDAMSASEATEVCALVPNEERSRGRC